LRPAERHPLPFAHRLPKPTKLAGRPQSMGDKKVTKFGKVDRHGHDIAGDERRSQMGSTTVWISVSGAQSLAANWRLAHGPSRLPSVLTNRSSPRAQPWNRSPLSTTSTSMIRPLRRPAVDGMNADRTVIDKPRHQYLSPQKARRSVSVAFRTSVTIAPPNSAPVLVPRFVASQNRTCRRLRGSSGTGELLNRAFAAAS
jgi:hypothetical protein